MAPTLKLVYFDVMARGLPLVMCLEHGGLEYEAKNVLRGDLDWAAMKASDDAPFDQLPVLFVDGKPIAQTAACAHVIGKIAGTDGGDDIADYAVSSMLISETEDIYKDLAKGAVTQFKELGDRAEDNKAMWAEAFPKHYAMLEKLVVAGGDAFTSTGVSVGEIYLWSILHQVSLMAGEAGKTSLDAFPKLKAFYDRVASMEKTKAVLEGKTAMGPSLWGQYFIE